MDQAQRGQLAFVLTLVGGVLNLLLALFFVAMAIFLGALFDSAAGSGPSENVPGWIFAGLLGSFALLGLVGGVTLLACAPRLRAPLPASRNAAIGAIVGGSICFLGGNVISAGLGIAGGILALTGPEAPAAGGFPP